MGSQDETTGTGFFKSSFFSSVSSSVTALTQTIQTKGLPELNKRLNELELNKKFNELDLNKKLTELQQRARELPSQIVNFQTDLESERTQFIQSKKVDGKNGLAQPAKGSIPVAPWEGYEGYEYEMKQAILDISKDKRNLLISPPEDTDFQFDLNAYSQNAQAILKEDKLLAGLRFSLVPQQVSEPTFWRNYFYRVTLVKQSVLSNPPSNITKKNEEVLFDFNDESSDEEEVKKENEMIEKEDFDLKEEIERDIIKYNIKDEDETTISSKDSVVVIEKKEDRKEENYEGMEEWEIELRKAAI